MNREPSRPIDDTDQSSVISENAGPTDLECTDAAQQLAEELGRLVGQHLAASTRVEPTGPEDRQS